jgi:hypothetical protein
MKSQFWLGVPNQAAAVDAPIADLFASLRLGRRATEQRC